jgi:hypothetical protein
MNRRICATLCLAISLITLVPPASGQVPEEYTPEEFVAVFIQAMEAYDGNPPVLASMVFQPCPSESARNDRALELMLTTDLGTRGTSRFATALFLARPRCEDPRLDDWFLEQLRTTAQANTAGTPWSHPRWGEPLMEYPLEVIRQPRFQELFWEVLRDEGIQRDTRSRAARALSRGRSPDERMALLFQLARERHYLPFLWSEIAVLVRDWPDVFVRATADAIRRQASWEELLFFVEHAGGAVTDRPGMRPQGVQFSPQIVADFRAAILAAEAAPPPHWPDEARSYIRRLADQLR